MIKLNFLIDQIEKSNFFFFFFKKKEHLMLFILTILYYDEINITISWMLQFKLIIKFLNLIIVILIMKLIQYLKFKLIHFKKKKKNERFYLQHEELLEGFLPLLSRLI